MTEDELITRLEMFKDNACCIMTANEVQQHIDLVKKLRSDRLELAETILKHCDTKDPLDPWEWTMCRYCGMYERGGGLVHKEDCIITKAEKIIKESRKL